MQFFTVAIFAILLSIFGYAADSAIEIPEELESAFHYKNLKNHKLIYENNALRSMLDPEWGYKAPRANDLAYTKENFKNVIDGMSSEKYVSDKCPLKSADLLYLKFADELRREKLISTQQKWVKAHSKLHELIVDEVLQPLFAERKIQEIGVKDLVNSYIKFFFEPISGISNNGKIIKTSSQLSERTSSYSPYDSSNYHPASISCPDWFYVSYFHALNTPASEKKFRDIFATMNQLREKIDSYNNWNYLQHKVHKALKENGFVANLANLSQNIVRSADLADHKREISFLTPADKRSAQLLSSSILNYLVHNSLLHELEQKDPEQIWLHKRFALCLSATKDEYLKKPKAALTKRLVNKLSMLNENAASYEIQAEALRDQIAECWNALCFDELRNIARRNSPRKHRDYFEQYLTTFDDEHTLLPISPSSETSTSETSTSEML